MIDIAGLDKAAVLAALWNNATPPPGHLVDSDTNTRMYVEEARMHLSNESGFDYLDGRQIKMDLGADSLDPHGYDRSNGSGLAARVIERLRQTGSIERLTT